MGDIKDTGARRKKWLLIILTLCLVLVAGGSWLVASRSGLEWLVSVMEQRGRGSLSVNGITGSLYDSFGLKQLVLQGEGWRVTLQDAQLQWEPAALLHGELKVLQLNVRQVDVLSISSGKPVVLPDSLKSPLAVNVEKMDIDLIRVFSHKSVTPDVSVSGVGARFSSDDQSYRLSGLRAHLPYGDLVGSAQIATGKPYALKAQLMLDTSLKLAEKQEPAHFGADADGDLQNIAIKLDANVAQMSVKASTQLTPFSTVTVSDLKMTFENADIARIFAGAPAALLSGSADLKGTTSGELEGMVQVQNAHAGPLDQKGFPVHAVTAQVKLSPASLHLQKLDARLPNAGHISGDAFWEVHEGKAIAHLKVDGIDPAALDTRLKSTRLHGDIVFQSRGREQHATVVLSDDKQAFRGELDRRGDKVELSNISLTRGETVLAGHGELALDRRRTFRFYSQLRKLDLARFTATPQTDLNADLEVSGTLFPEPAGTLRVKLSDSYVAKNAVSGNGQLEFTGMRSVKADAEVKLGDNQLKLYVLYGVGADIARLIFNAPNLAQIRDDLGGELAGNADLSGSFENPRLQFSIHGTRLVLPNGQHIAELDTTGDLASAAMQLNFKLKDVRNSSTLRIPEATIALHGSRAQHTLRANAHIAQGGDELGEFTLQAQGGLSDPGPGWKTVRWQGAIDELDAQGILPFHLLTAAPLMVARDSLELGAADVAISGGHVIVSDAEWNAQGWHSAGRFNSINLRAVNTQQNRFLSDNFDTMRFGGSWDIKADKHLQGKFQMQRENGDVLVDAKNGLHLGLRDMQLLVSAEQDKLQASLDISGERVGKLKAQASVPLTHTDTGWTIMPEAQLVGHLGLHTDDLSWLGPILDSNLQTGGRLDFDADLLGTFQSPRLQGNAQGDELSFALLDQGVRLEHGKLKARFETDTVHIDQLTFDAPYQPSPHDKLLADYTLPAGAGQLSANGRIDLSGDSSDMQIAAERMPLAQSADRWIIASGNGHARYANRILMLDGNIHADAGLINQPVSSRPQLSDDIQIIGQDPVRRGTPPISVEATLDLGDRFYIRASGLEGRLAGELKVHGEPGESLQVTGIIAAHDAVFDAYGQRLQVERGLVNFQGPLDDPGLNILALRKGLSVEAGVEVTGTVRRPSVRLVSTPNVPDGEKLSWIVLGRVPESTGVDSSLLIAAAGSILGGQSVGKFGQTLGIDEISISQQAGGETFQSQKVTIGKQLSSRARISYEQGLSEVGGVTKFTYTLTPRITIVTRTGIEDALDIFYSFRFY